MLFKDQSESIIFLDYINGKHLNIKNSIEREVDGTLRFLDCTVTKKDKKFFTSVYRKHTLSGLGKRYFAFCAFRFKMNPMKTLLCRAYNVSANYQFLHREFDFFFSVPYFGFQPDRLPNELSGLHSELVPNYDFAIIQVNRNKFGSFFNF